MAIGSTTAILVGGGLAATGTILGGIQASNQAKAGAQANQIAAQEALTASREKERDFRRKMSAVAARNLAIAGGSGIDPSKGSPLLVDEDFAREAELQALRIRRGGAAEATLLQNRARALRTSGRSQLIGSFFRAGSQIMRAGGLAKFGQNPVFQQQRTTDFSDLQEEF